MATIPKALVNVQRQAIPTNTTQAAQSRGMGQMGQALGQASDALSKLDARAQEEREKLEMAEVLKAESDLSRQRASLEIKFGQMQGRNAAEKSADYVALLDKTRSAIAERFKDNPRLASIYYQRTENGRNSTAAFYERHVAGEGQRMQEEAYTTYEQTARDEAARKWADKDAFQQVVNDASSAFLAREKARGADEQTAYKRFNASVQALYLKRMDAALDNKDAAAARAVFEQTKGQLSGAAEDYERKVEALELPEQAEAVAGASMALSMKDGSRWFDPETARAQVEGLPDSDRRKAPARALLADRTREQDDSQRRLWDKQLSELSNLRFGGVSLFDKRISVIMAEATDPRNRYSAEARAWWQRELDRAEEKNDRRKGQKQSEADRLAMLSYHAMTLEERADPKADGSPEARTFRKNIVGASYETVLKIRELQLEDDKRRKGGDVNYSSGRTRALEVAEPLGIDKGQAAQDYESWYATFPVSSPPTAKDLDAYLGRVERKYVGKNRVLKDRTVYGAGTPKPTGGLTDPDTYEVAPAEEQTPRAQRVLEAESAAAGKNLAGKVVGAEQEKARDPRNSQAYKAWTALADSGFDSVEVNRLRKAGYTPEQAKEILSQK